MKTKSLIFYIGLFSFLTSCGGSGDKARFEQTIQEISPEYRKTDELKLVQWLDENHRDVDIKKFEEEIFNITPNFSWEKFWLEFRRDFTFEKIENKDLVTHLMIKNCEKKTSEEIDIASRDVFLKKSNKKWAFTENYLVMLKSCQHVPSAEHAQMLLQEAVKEKQVDLFSHLLGFLTINPQMYLSMREKISSENWDTMIDDITYGRKKINYATGVELINLHKKYVPYAKDQRGRLVNFILNLADGNINEIAKSSSFEEVADIFEAEINSDVFLENIPVFNEKFSTQYDVIKREGLDDAVDALFYFTTKFSSFIPKDPQRMIPAFDDFFLIFEKKVLENKDELFLGSVPGGSKNTTLWKWFLWRQGIVVNLEQECLHQQNLSFYEQLIAYRLCYYLAGNNEEKTLRLEEYKKYLESINVPVTYYNKTDHNSLQKDLSERLVRPLPQIVYYPIPKEKRDIKVEFKKKEDERKVIDQIFIVPDSNLTIEGYSDQSVVFDLSAKRKHIPHPSVPVLYDEVLTNAAAIPVLIKIEVEETKLSKKMNYLVNYLYTYRNPHFFFKKIESEKGFSGGDLFITGRGNTGKFIHFLSVGGEGQNQHPGQIRPRRIDYKSVQLQLLPSSYTKKFRSFKGYDHKEYGLVSANMFRKEMIGLIKKGTVSLEHSYFDEVTRKVESSVRKGAGDPQNIDYSNNLEMMSSLRYGISAMSYFERDMCVYPERSTVESMEMPLSSNEVKCVLERHEEKIVEAFIDDMHKGIEDSFYNKLSALKIPSDLELLTEKRLEFTPKHGEGGRLIFSNIK
jgi:hypothetical protein